MRRSKEGAQISAQQQLDGVQLRIGDRQIGPKVTFKALGKVLRGTLRPPHPGTGRGKRSSDATHSGHRPFMALPSRQFDRATWAKLGEVLRRSVIEVRRRRAKLDLRIVSAMRGLLLL